MSKDGIQKFQSNAYWFWQNFATNGKIETIRYSVGSNENRGNSNERGGLKWFIDNRPWSHVYSNTATGNSKHESKQKFIDDVRNGKMVRFIIRYSNQPTTSLSAYNADNVAISTGNNDIAAMHIRSISIRSNGTDNVSFETNPYWYFILTATSVQIFLFISSIDRY